MTAFFRGTIYREICFGCQYANCNRVGTYTIADFWGIGKHGVKFSKGVAAGVSMVIDNTGRFEELIKDVSGEVYYELRTLDEARADNGNLNEPVSRRAERDTAIIDMLNPDVSLLDYAKKYNMLDGKLPHLVKKTFKNVIYGLHLYNVYKTISYKLGKS